MKKLRFLLIALFSLTTCCYMSAQEDYDMEEVVEEEVCTELLGSGDELDFQSCVAVYATNSECNQGAEPFYEFISKFKSKKSFRKSRVYINKEDPLSEYAYDMQSVVVKYLNEPISENMLKWVKDDTDPRGGYFVYTTAYWYGASENAIYFRYDVDNDHEEDGSGWNMWCEFKRIDGKWYLTRVVDAG